ncbi:hypothetical protein Acr_27g0000220 [Actinidia rufa]|uniref:Uncharacterized protein n=1 Tax=Actinidia rufa TaxID=165716 RepID=A0A7J0H5A4_9ERIC|nr:hypothetical protein Acr_27g0000220 [Actinidia rufa]
MNAGGSKNLWSSYLYGESEVENENNGVEAKSTSRIILSLISSPPTLDAEARNLIWQGCPTSFFTWGRSSSLEASLLVATPPPIERETNIMTKDKLDLLRESLSFPLRVQIKIPKEDEIIASTRMGDVVFYEAIFHAGLPTIRKILYYHNIYPTQLIPKTWRSVICMILVGCTSRQGREIACSEDIPAMSRYGRRIFFSSRKTTGIFPLERPGMLEFQGFRSRGSSQVGKHCNKLLVLCIVEYERLQAILDSILGGNPFIIKEFFDSKFFFKCFKVATQFMAFGERNKEDNPPISRAASIAGNEGESHHSRDEPCRCNHSRDNSIEYLGTIRKRMRQILPPDLSLLRLLRGKSNQSSLIWTQVAQVQVQRLGQIHE